LHVTLNVGKGPLTARTDTVGDPSHESCLGCFLTTDLVVELADRGQVLVVCSGEGLPPCFRSFELFLKRLRL